MSLFKKTPDVKLRKGDKFTYQSQNKKHTCTVVGFSYSDNDKSKPCYKLEDSGLKYSKIESINTPCWYVDKRLEENRYKQVNRKIVSTKRKK